MPRKIRTDRKNILQRLAGRELGLERCSSVEKFSQLRLLVSQSANRRFLELRPSPHQCYGKIRYAYGEGKIILPNREEKTVECFDLRHNRHQMIRLWSVPAPPRWEDFLVESGPLPPPLSPPLHCGKFIVVRRP